MPPKNERYLELPDGCRICEDHRQIVCQQCGVDYSSTLLIEEDLSGRTLTAPGIISLPKLWKRSDINKDDFEKDGDGPGSHITRAKLRYAVHRTLIVPEIPSFIPPTPAITPQVLFSLQKIPSRQFPRFVNQGNSDQILIYTDGACLNSGQLDAVGGWGAVFRSPETNLPIIGQISHRLEDRGLSGGLHTATNNRAALRAVIGALRFRVWFGEGWKLVIATDSEYVSKGATEWIRT